MFRLIFGEFRLDEQRALDVEKEKERFEIGWNRARFEKNFFFCDKLIDKITIVICDDGCIPSIKNLESLTHSMEFNNFREEFILEFC